MTLLLPFSPITHVFRLFELYEVDTGFDLDVSLYEDRNNESAILTRCFESFEVVCITFVT